MKRYLTFPLSLLLAGSALAQSGQTINQLSPGAALQGTEQIPMYQAANPAVTTTPSAVATYALGTPRSGLHDWVNIKDPRFGAVGNNSTDDTAAIQAAIDYAFANNLTGVYCPAGTYKTTGSLYLDPPGNLRSNLSNPGNSAFSAAFFGDPAAGGDYQGCRIQPTFNNAVALYVGPGQGMRVSDIQITGPSNGYRGQQSSAGVGIGLTGGSAGSSGNLIDNVNITNFYTLFETGANGACTLNDSNQFRKVRGTNAYYGFWLGGSCDTQAYINTIIDPEVEATVAIYSPLSKAVNVFGGNLSANNSQSSSFGVSGISSFTKTGGGNGYAYSFAATIASPNQYINTVYNSYTMVTAHFGIVPLVMTGWNAGTHVATLLIWPGWVFANYGALIDLTTATDIQAEVAAVTTLYASERVTVADGMGIALDGVHIEDSNTCTTLFMQEASFGGQKTNEGRNLLLNYDPSVPATTAHLYCQRTFPFIGEGPGGQNATLRLTGGTYNSSYPLNLESFGQGDMKGEQLNGLKLNFRFTDNGGYTFKQLNGYGQFATAARGGGLWDHSYFTPPAFYGYTAGGSEFIAGELISPYCGVEPCPSVTPNLSPTIFGQVCPSASGGGSYGAVYTCATLGSLGSYPPIACRTTYKSVDWNTGAIGAGIFKRSASCPGYSWGQNLIDATVGSTVTWSYKGQSDALYLDAQTIKWMFPGLGISINNGSGAVQYVVTAIYPDLGYVTVMDTQYNPQPLAGTKTTVYSCSSGCTIGQASYSWSAY